MEELFQGIHFLVGEAETHIGVKGSINLLGAGHQNAFQALLAYIDHLLAGIPEGQAQFGSGIERFGDVPKTDCRVLFHQFSMPLGNPFAGGITGGQFLLYQLAIIGKKQDAFVITQEEVHAQRVGSGYAVIQAFFLQSAPILPPGGRIFSGCLRSRRTTSSRIPAAFASAFFPLRFG